MEQRNLTLLTDLYELTMMQGYFKEKDANETVVFDMFYRTNPHGNGFAICAGLQQVIEYIEDLHFDDSDIEYLRSLDMFEEDFLSYLNEFRFTGNIYAIPEGTVVFPREPLVKVIAPLCRPSSSRQRCSISSITRVSLPPRQSESSTRPRETVSWNSDCAGPRDRMPAPTAQGQP